MAEKESLRRTGDVRIKLAPGMLERLEKMADAYGMPPATLAAFALAEWINGKEHGVTLARMSVMDMSRKMAGPLQAAIEQIANSPEFEADLLHSSSTVADALTQPNLTLDSGAPVAGA